MTRSPADYVRWEGQVPWHLWGTTETVEVPLLVPGTGQATSQQIARVNYRRPESWRWLFMARLLAAPTAGVGDSIAIDVFWDVVLGIGRSNLRIPGFASMRWSYQGPGQAQLGQVLLSGSTSGVSTIFSDGVVADVITRNDIDRIVAQDIQCNARVIATSVNVGTVRVELTGQFAPNVHVRPDWHSDHPFTGSETGGS